MIAHSGKIAAAALLLAICAAPVRAEPPGGPYGPLPGIAEEPDPAVHAANVCALIEGAAAKNALPAPFFARLIWKESRFDPGAVSPAGAEGIAQFMPGTAALRGLDNSFDMYKAIPASARYLAEMAATYGNLGMAAIGYNAGEARLRRWMDKGGFLPLETENYVASILGEPADNFADPAYRPEVSPLDKERSFGDACKAMPAVFTSTVAMANVNVKPWGIQVAGNIRRAAALRQWERVRARFAGVLDEHEPVVSRVRNPRGRAGIYAVRIGAENRKEADGICAALRKGGGACVVMKNR
ncbi:MAG TPA: lytic transglycosylase domain-containing protein [Rhizobiaceae bacterium]|nr:lytic transglycosylase domain-containing protein [Rhizobiaceae bacterium]